MARNATRTLTPAESDRADWTARLVARYVGTSHSLAFQYTDRSGVRSEREGIVLGLVGEPGTSTYGVKIDTPNGPRTFNLYLMG